MTNVSFNQELLPRFNEIKPDQIEPLISGLLAKNRQKIAEIFQKNSTFTWENLMQPLEDMGDELAKKWAPIGHLHAVCETENLRAAYNNILPQITEYHTEISQNEQLYSAILSIKNSKEFEKLTPAQQKIIENDIRDFKLAGIHLPKEKKTQLAELQMQLSKLMTTFAEHLLDATNAFSLHVADKKELAGLPEQAIQLAEDNAKVRGVNGYVFTLDYPSYSTAIKFLQNRNLRQKMYEAYSTRASDVGPMKGKWDNTQIMEDILKVRHDMAQLVGFDSFASYSLATKMAKTPQEVLQFLEDLLARSKPLAQAEYREVCALAKELDGLQTLETWDIAYYSEKLRERDFNFSPEDLRPYFPIDRVLNGMFTIVNKLYGITIRKEKNINVWHENAEFFSLYDDKNQLRAGFYIDLYARPKKRDGAWMDECRVRRANGREVQHPVAFLTCNFMRPIEGKPALLTHDDVLTLFHEFGHCLHHMLTKVDFPSVSGINGVPWDAVEFPSQFMENFCWEKSVLDMISAHYQTGAPLPKELFDKMVAAKHFQTGLQLVRQLEFSLFDFHLHLDYDPEKMQQVQEVLDLVRLQSSVVPVAEFNRFQHSFSHVFAGSYAAGYYSYKWAEVLSSDAYAKFEEQGIFDATTGRSFMDNILSVGGVRDPMHSFIAFRGREPTIDALLRHSGIIETHAA